MKRGLSAREKSGVVVSDGVGRITRSVQLQAHLERGLGWCREEGLARAGMTWTGLDAPTAEGALPAAVPAPSTHTAKVEGSSVPRMQPDAPRRKERPRMSLPEEKREGHQGEDRDPPVSEDGGPGNI